MLLMSIISNSKLFKKKKQSLNAMKNAVIRVPPKQTHTHTHTIDVTM